MRTTSLPLDSDPFGDEILASDPYPTYKRLRDESPLHRTPLPRLFTASRYAEITSILQQPDLFSSDAFRILFSGRPTGGLVASVKTAATMLPALLTHPRAARILASRFLIAEDPPRHTAMRNIVNRAFTPRRIASWEERIREIARSHWQEVRRKPEFDLVEGFAAPVPLAIIVELLGFEPEWRNDFRRWSDSFMSQFLGPDRKFGLRKSGALDTIDEMGLYVRKLVRARKGASNQGLISTLIDAQLEQGVLSETEAVFFAIGLLPAGHETTRCLIANAVHALLQHPRQLAEVSNDPSRIPAVVEETLRWNGPVHLAVRRARRATEIASVPIPRNSIVVARIASGNRDERKWGADSDAFDMSRDSRGHLAFSLGPHFCVGAGLARLEARVALEVVLSDLPKLTLRKTSVECVPSFGARGPKHLPVAWRE